MTTGDLEVAFVELVLVMARDAKICNKIARDQRVAGDFAFVIKNYIPTSSFRLATSLTSLVPLQFFALVLNTFQASLRSFLHSL